MEVTSLPSNAAIEGLLEELEPRIRATFSRFRIPPQDAEDLLQQALLVYLYKSDSVESPEKWFIGTLRNRCLSYWRERRRKLYTALDEALLENVAAARESPQEALDLQQDMRSLLTQLPVRCRNLLTLRYQEGCDAPEAARRLGSQRIDEGVAAFVEIAVEEDHLLITRFAVVAVVPPVAVAVVDVRLVFDNLATGGEHVLEHDVLRNGIRGHGQSHLNLVARLHFAA